MVNLGPARRAARLGRVRDRCARVRVSPDARGRAASERSEIVTMGLTYQAQTVIYS